MTFSEKLKLLRKEKKLNQEQASHKIGISLSTLRKYEQIGNPDIPQLKKIKDFYNVSYDYLLNDNCNNRITNDFEIEKELGVTEKSKNNIRKIENKEFFEYVFKEEYGKLILEILEEQAKTRFAENYLLNRFCMKLYRKQNYNEPTENDIHTIKNLIEYLKQKKMKQSFWEILMNNEYYPNFLSGLEYILKCWEDKKEINVNSKKLTYFNSEILEKVCKELSIYDNYCSSSLSWTINKFCSDYEENRILKLK